VNPDRADSLLGRAAERARGRPAFLGWVLAEYERLEGLSGEQLRDRLSVAVEHWRQLQLCLRPRAEEFLADVTEIASEFGVDRVALATIVRRVEAVEVIRTQEQQPSEAGSMLAARTRTQPPPAPEAPSDGTAGS
jgi:hypothetical protein